MEQLEQFPQVDGMDMSPEVTVTILMFRHHKNMARILKYNLKGLTQGKQVGDKVKVITYLMLLSQWSIQDKVIKPLKDWVKAWNKILKEDKKDEFAATCKKTQQQVIHTLNHLLETLKPLEKGTYTLLDQSTIDSITESINNAIVGLGVAENID